MMGFESLRDVERRFARRCREDFHKEFELN